MKPSWEQGGRRMQPQEVTNAVLNEMNARTGRLRERAQQMTTELAAVREVVRSRDGLATVTVGAGGIMHDVVIGSGSGGTPDRIRKAVMSAYQEGCRLVGLRAAEITQRYAPGSPAVAMMRDAIPPDPDEAEERKVEYR